MQTVVPKLARGELLGLRRGLAGATDARLVEILGLIDQMTERGAVDGLIEPLRARLGQIRPPRPLRFSRLLFLPLDSVIVPAAVFRAGTPTVPRSAVAPLAAMVHTALGPCATEIDAALIGRTTSEFETVQHLGDALWPEAAAILLHALQPAGWAVAGLPATLYKPLVMGIGAVLEQAATLQTLIADSTAGLPIRPEVVDVALAKAAPNGPEACSLVLAVLLGRLPDAGAVLREANAWVGRQGNPALRVAFDRASDTQLSLFEARDNAVAELLGPDLATAGVQVHRVIGLLDELGDESMPAARRARVEAIRARLDTACRACFADNLAVEFLAPLHASRQAAGSDAALRLENAARRLRELETEARCLGGGKSYDALLQQTALVVRRLGPDAGLELAEKVRLVEILAGPEEALSLVE